MRVVQKGERYSLEGMTLSELESLRGIVKGANLVEKRIFTSVFSKIESKE